MLITRLKIADLENGIIALKIVDVSVQSMADAETVMLYKNEEFVFAIHRLKFLSPFKKTKKQSHKKKTITKNNQKNNHLKNQSLC